MANSILQSEKCCYITGSTERLHRHHIFRGKSRKYADDFGCWVWLRWDWHNGADYGVHGKDGGALDVVLKRKCQRKFEEIHGHEKFMAVFGRDYLD